MLFNLTTTLMLSSGVDGALSVDLVPFISDESPLLLDHWDDEVKERKIELFC